MELLRYVDSYFSTPNLSSLYIVAAQHLLESNRKMFQWLIRRGVSPSNIFVLGKCYSTNGEVLEAFKRMGVNVSEKSKYYDPKQYFQAYFSEITKDFLHNCLEDIPEGETVLVLEDGGNLLCHVHRLQRPKHNFLGVEQTSAGYRKLKGLDLNFPIINVARSEAKLQFESPFIAEKAVQVLKQKNALKGRALIIGGGAIGTAIQAELGETPDIYDRIDENNEVNGSLADVIGTYDLIIGCTGEKAISTDLHDLLKPGCTLASLSSGDREFSAAPMRRKYNVSKEVHADLQCGPNVLLNAGFPVNFTGERNSVKEEYIQLTLSLLVSAICLVHEEQYENGIHDLDRELQKKLVQRFTEIQR